MTESDVTDWTGEGPSSWNFVFSVIIRCWSVTTNNSTNSAEITWRWNWTKNKLIVRKKICSFYSINSSANGIKSPGIKFHLLLNPHKNSVKWKLSLFHFVNKEECLEMWNNLKISEGQNNSRILVYLTSKLKFSSLPGMSLHHPLLLFCCPSKILMFSPYS